MQELGLGNSAVVTIRSIPWNEHHITLNQRDDFSLHRNPKLSIQDLKRCVAGVVVDLRGASVEEMLNCDRGEGEVAGGLDGRDEWLDDLVVGGGNEVFWSVVPGDEEGCIGVGGEGVVPVVPGCVGGCGAVDEVTAGDEVEFSVDVEDLEGGDDASWW